MNKDAISIVLVQPQGARNIGSVCRVMANFGFTDLRLVTPEADHLSDEALHMAVTAKGMLGQARVYDSLADAVADCGVAVATTRRFGRYRENFLDPPTACQRLLDVIKGNRAALVFGREDHGLSTAEIDQCQLLCSIPTDNRLPSMNLAQAVTVMAYELDRWFSSCQTTLHNQIEHSPLACNIELEAMILHMRTSLVRAGYLSADNPDHIARAYRRIFGRAGLSPREVRILQGLWSRIDWLCDQLNFPQNSSE